MGGLFAQFSLDSSGKYVTDPSGLRPLAAVQMAINKINDKSDEIYDELLPRTRVRYTEYALLLGAMLFALRLCMCNAFCHVLSSNCWLETARFK